jgi:hypothetical protein
MGLRRFIVLSETGAVILFIFGGLSFSVMVLAFLYWVFLGDL